MPVFIFYAALTSYEAPAAAVHFYHAVPPDVIFLVLFPVCSPCGSQSLSMVPVTCHSSIVQGANQ